MSAPTRSRDPATPHAISHGFISFPQPDYKNLQRGTMTTYEIENVAHPEYARLVVLN